MPASGHPSWPALPRPKAAAVTEVGQDCIAHVQAGLDRFTFNGRLVALQPCAVFLTLAGSQGLQSSLHRCGLQSLVRPVAMQQIDPAELAEALLLCQGAHHCTTGIAISVQHDTILVKRRERPACALAAGGAFPQLDQSCVMWEWNCNTCGCMLACCRDVDGGGLPLAAAWCAVSCWRNCARACPCLSCHVLTLETRIRDALIANCQRCLDGVACYHLGFQCQEHDSQCKLPL